MPGKNEKGWLGSILNTRRGAKKNGQPDNRKQGRGDKHDNERKGGKGDGPSSDR